MHNQKKSKQADVAGKKFIVYRASTETVSPPFVVSNKKNRRNTFTGTQHEILYNLALILTAGQSFLFRNFTLKCLIAEQGVGEWIISRPLRFLQNNENAIQ